MSLSVVNVHVFGELKQFRDACAEEQDRNLVVTRNGRTIARYDREAVRNWWIDEPE